MGTEEWLELLHDDPRKLSFGKVFWHVAKNGAVPTSWRFEYLDAAGEWRPVKNPTAYVVEPERWCRVDFDPVDTVGIRVVAQLAMRKTGGISEVAVGFGERREEAAEDKEKGEEPGAEKGVSDEI